MKNTNIWFLRCLLGESHFEDDGSQNSLACLAVHKYFKKIVDTNHILAWISKGLSNESIKPPESSNNNPAVAKNYIDSKIKLNESCLQEDKITFKHKKVVNIYLFYEINLQKNIQSAVFALRNSLFGAVKLTNNTYTDEYKYSGFGIEFKTHGSFSLSNGGEFGKNAKVFGADMSSLLHIDNKKKAILILGKSPTEGLD